MPSSRFAMSPAAKALGVMDPAQVYPFYEVAAQAAWGLAPEAAEQDSAALWARYAKVAADNRSRDSSCSTARGADRGRRAVTAASRLCCNQLMFLLPCTKSANPRVVSREVVPPRFRAFVIFGK